MGRKSRSKKHHPAELRQSANRDRTAAKADDWLGALLEPSSTKNWLFAALLIVVVFLAYQPAWNGRFVWDDDLHLLNNPVLAPGGLTSAWVDGSYINYWPLTFTVYRFEYECWGLDPLGFHLVNIALHALTSLLLWRVLVELAVPGAMLAAAIFALHPVNVESVAWIAQLKGILSLLFAVVSTLFYLQYDRRGGWWRYVAAIAAFCLSTLAKGMVLTLPAVLLACVWWRRGSIGWRDLLRVVPYLLIGALMTGIEIFTQQRGAGDEVVRSDGPFSRAAVAGCAVWFYFGKLLWPLDLCWVYPRWKIDDGDIVSYLPGPLLLAIVFALAAWQYRSWGRPVLLLIICYVALLLPALGFVSVFFMKYSLVADHWQYAATIVPIVVITGIAATWAFRNPGRLHVACALGLLLLLILTGLTWQQSKMYANFETLYRSTIERNSHDWLAHNNLGAIVAARGQTDEAIALYQKALENKPDYVEALNNLGNALSKREKFDEAIPYYRKALEIDPSHVEFYGNLARTHNNLGLVLARRGEFDEAMRNYRKALEIDPGFDSAHNNLGNALIKSRQVDEAISHYLKALEIKPDYFEAHRNLALALVSHRQFNEAIDHYRKALEIKPLSMEVHAELASALADSGRPAEALDHYQQALDLAEAQNDKGSAIFIREKMNKLRK